MKQAIHVAIDFTRQFFKLGNIRFIQPFPINKFWAIAIYIYIIYKQYIYIYSNATYEMTISPLAAHQKPCYLNHWNDFYCAPGVENQEKHSYINGTNHTTPPPSKKSRERDPAGSAMFLAERPDMAERCNDQMCGLSVCLSPTCEKIDLDCYLLLAVIFSFPWKSNHYFL